MNELFSDKLPLTFQLAQLLRARILRGEYGKNGRLAPEVQLAQEFGVSVITVQRALKELEQEGLITRHRGRGTFVTASRPSLGPPQGPDALSLMFSDEFDDTTEILEWASTDELNHPANFPDGVDHAMKLRRLVYRGGAPWSYATVYVHPEHASKLSDDDLKHYPMFRLMGERLGIALGVVDIDLQAVIAPPEVSTILKVEPMSPATFFTGALYDRDGVLLTALHIYYRGDAFTFRFQIDLARNQAICGPSSRKG